MTYTLSRRSFVKGGLVAGSAAAFAPLLAGCGSDTAGSATNAGIKLPTYAPIKSALTADLPGDAPRGIQEGYFNYPADPFRSVQGKPLSGGKVTALHINYTPPPTPLSSNSYWQAVNDRIGGSIENTQVASADYNTKLAVVTAGNDLPDLVLFTAFAFTPPVARFPQLLDARFADLTEHLSGDAVKRYPNLANLPTSAWPWTVRAGKIYGVPLPRAIFSEPLYLRQDIVDAKGLTPAQNADEFLEFCVELTDAKAGRWAMGSSNSGNGALNLQAFLAMFGAPRGWRKNPDGTLTKDVETEEYAEAVGYMRTLWQKGVYHPDSPTMTGAQGKDALAAGSIAIFQDGLSAVPIYLATYGKDHPQMRLRYWEPVKHDGGRAPAFQGPGLFGMVSIKKADKRRVEELLRVLDFFAAPFGSQEQQLLTFGLDGKQFTRDAKGNPVANPDGAADMACNFQYLGNGPQVMYNATYPDWVRDQHEWETKVSASTLSDPTVGLSSDTDGKIGATLTRKATDTMRDVVTGRAPVSALAQLAKDWRSGGGDQIRQEYEQELANAN